MTTRDFQEYKQRYDQACKIVSIVLDGDRHDELSKHLRQALTIQQLIELQEFISIADNQGMKLLTQQAN
jgi:hypothetical protein